LWNRAWFLGGDGIAADKGASQVNKQAKQRNL
jgi:hypothetical protein